MNNIINAITDGSVKVIVNMTINDFNFFNGTVVFDDYSESDEAYELYSPNMEIIIDKNGKITETDNGCYTYTYDNLIIDFEIF